ncbi:FAD-binding protein [Desulfurivibrio alkaliphilus]|uniref:Electron transfer flavoprotein alpha/beta-subunit n=1 Tax=Desulfurivibrio alkaliphilus (strain DSM 19089 / UNIQEM U267 / AHT2) TaxID=589865 RepID=D6Z625_DESAT|nr:FAD-binding protein [Desulfurivibrio alkaliphilus]ADH84907.1 Electron transfer flavoprotein alpha/beta-subunit [Desulfurivibrio alkaliphilus AHT 2]
MSNYIVLVKQVPDVARITDNAFDPDTGNLIRSRLASVINELDAQALAFAWRMKEISGDTGARLICLSMGPPMAAEVLRYGLSRGADAGVLLTDRALGGADTPATANPLAHAIKKIKAEMLADDDDYFVVAGMQSVDGDTAQVPPQIAEELGIGCIPYATEVEFVDGRFRFHHIISGGSQVVEARRRPAVITVAQYDYTLYASFAATRQANRSELVQWGADDVKPTAMGGSGSKTRVIRVFPPPKTNRLGRQLHSVAELAGVLRETLHQQSRPGDEGRQGPEPDYLLPSRRSFWFDRPFEGTAKECDDFAQLASILVELGIKEPGQITEQVKEQVLAAEKLSLSPKVAATMLDGLGQQETAYQGEVWVMAEHEEGALNAATFELTGKARELADSLEVPLGVVLAGDGVRELAPELIAAGADKVYLLEHPLLEEFDPLSYRKAVAELFAVHRPQILLYGATPQGRVLAPMVAYRTGCGLTADCTELTIRDISRQGQLAVMMQTRPALGGNIMATICSRNSSCQMATARPGVMQRRPADPARRGEIITHQVELTEEDLGLAIIERAAGGEKVDFACDILVGGGKGLASRDNFVRLLDELNAALTAKFKVKVGKGASRAAVEQGFIARAFQVGQTGTAVGPKVYLAVGISGAIQHMIGVAASGTIIAINADPAAPIFKQCDYYLVGRAEQVIPELIVTL